jgi:ankyrin repeat protein
VHLAGLSGSVPTCAALVAINTDDTDNNSNSNNNNNNNTDDDDNNGGTGANPDTVAKDGHDSKKLKAQRDEKGQTPSEVAAAAGHESAARALDHIQISAAVDDGGDGDAASSGSPSAQAGGKSRDEELLDAARAWDAGKVDVMLGEGADPNAAGESDGKTALHFAAMLGNRQMVDALLAKDANPNARDALGKTPLHYAGAAMQASITAALVAAGADRRAEDADGNTPVHAAAEAGDVATVKGLVGETADAAAKDTHGSEDLRAATNTASQIPYELAREHDHGDAAALLKPSGSLLDAVLAGDLDTVKRLLDDSANPQSLEATTTAPVEGRAEGEGEGEDEDDTVGGRTALHIAADLGHVEILRHLLAAGAAVDPRDDMERTPLHVACFSAQSACVHPLLAAGADRGAADQWGRTPAHCAGESHSVPTCAAVVSVTGEGDVDPDTIAIDGHTSAALKTLRDDAGLTPADLAAEQEKSETAAALAPATDADGDSSSNNNNAAQTADAPADAANVEDPEEVAKDTEEGAKDEGAKDEGAKDEEQVSVVEAEKGEEEAAAESAPVVAEEVAQTEEESAEQPPAKEDSVEPEKTEEPEAQATVQQDTASTDASAAPESSAETAETPAESAPAEIAPAESKPTESAPAPVSPAPAKATTSSSSSKTTAAKPRSGLAKESTTAIEAVLAEDPAALKRILGAGGADAVDAADDDGLTALHHAAIAGSAELVGILLENGADVKRTDLRKRTSLYVACLNARAEVATVLLAAGANRGAKDRDGDTPIHAAGRAGDLATARAVISRHPDLDGTDADAGGADVDAGGAGTDPDEAAKDGHASTALRLARGRGGMLPFEAVTARGDARVAALLRPAPDRDTLPGAAALGDIDAVRALLAKAGKADNAGKGGGGDDGKGANVSVDDTDVDGMTALHHAARTGNAEIAEAVLAAGGAVDALDGKENTPLHIAAANDGSGEYVAAATLLNFILKIFPCPFFFFFLCKALTPLTQPHQPPLLSQSRACAAGAWCRFGDSARGGWIHCAPHCRTRWRRGSDLGADCPRRQGACQGQDREHARARCCRGPCGARSCRRARCGRRGKRHRGRR